jgi:very-short-patch-repair endonuclease
MNNYLSITALARNLRRNQTPEESILWNELRNRKLSGKKFLRQHPVIYEEINRKKYFFIADFYCAGSKLVIELDGKIHNFHKDYDLQRDMVLNAKGIRVLHIENKELENKKFVLRKIKDLL